MGDKITAVDGEPTEGKSLKAIIEMSRGEQGSSVEVTLRQNANERTVKLTRDIVPMTSLRVNYETYERRSVASITLDRITSSTVHELRQVERAAAKKGVEGIILHFSSASAAFHETKLVADAFVADKHLGYRLTRDGLAEFKAGPTQLFDGLPVVAVVPSSVSAELGWLLAALRDGRGVAVAGLASVGTSQSNEMVPLPGSRYTLSIPTGILLQANKEPVGWTVPDNRMQQVIGHLRQIQQSPRSVDGDAVLRTAKKMLLQQIAEHQKSGEGETGE